jgi:hypothetical protein
MSAAFEQVQQNLRDSPKTWLITGCAGVIGSNLLEHLLKLDQTVVGLDNFSTCKQQNSMKYKLWSVKSNGSGSVLSKAISAIWRPAKRFVLGLVTSFTRPRWVRYHARLPIHRDFRAGDVLHSQADVGKARELLCYVPTHTIKQGLAEVLEWSVGSLSDGLSPTRGLAPKVPVPRP